MSVNFNNFAANYLIKSWRCEITKPPITKKPFVASRSVFLWHPHITNNTYSLWVTGNIHIGVLWYYSDSKVGSAWWLLMSWRQKGHLQPSWWRWSIVASKEFLKAITSPIVLFIKRSFSPVLFKTTRVQQPAATNAPQQHYLFTIPETIVAGIRYR